MRPDHLGIAHVAVVVPTFSWQAYNRRDGDTWYACTLCAHCRYSTRPYLDSGVPYNFKAYDRGFLAWLARTDRQADVISDQDLNRFANGAVLRRLYRMVVFEGHGEYATSHMFDITEQYRNLGGHLAFLSANQFFRDVVVTGRSMTLIGRFRDLGRPEAALIGSQYINWNRNLYPDQQYVVRGANKVPRLFAGTGLRNGSHILRNFGVEIDGLAPSSPPHTIVIADIRNIFPGETAQMTYYTTRAGAEVFDAGTINFGGSALVTDVSEMLSNLWSTYGRYASGAAPRRRLSRGATCTPAASSASSVPASVASTSSRFNEPRWPILNTRPARRASPAPSDRLSSRAAAITSVASAPSGITIALAVFDCSAGSRHSSSRPHAATAVRTAWASAAWRA